MPPNFQGARCGFSEKSDRLVVVTLAGYFYEAEIKEGKIEKPEEFSLNPKGSGQAPH